MQLQRIFEAERRAKEKVQEAEAKAREAEAEARRQSEETIRKAEEEAKRSEESAITDARREAESLRAELGARAEKAESAWRESFAAKGGEIVDRIVEEVLGADTVEGASP